MPVFDVQTSAARHHSNHGWLQTAYSFSFADYHDPDNTQWGSLRVLNDDRIAPGKGFGMHPHADMEILTYVLSGELTHEDSMGNAGALKAGGVQYMSAGTGVVHAERNDGQNELHLVQMWVLPDQKFHQPQYGQ
ncbi:MAG: pirin family protein, partial [Candidatus Micrarchaeota archaeon]|nr:pirin family protein [Candidatus Micrarchaeota archaeon]